MLTVTCISGPMASGKTALLISHLKRAEAAGHAVVGIKPACDTRAPAIRSRTGTTFPALSLTESDLVSVGFPMHVPLPGKLRVIGVDESQFFPHRPFMDALDSLILTMNTRAECPTWLLIAGLAEDSDLRHWGPIPDVSKRVERVGFPVEWIKRTARCEVCEEPAAHTFCKVKKEQRVMVGGSEVYGPRCPTCFHVGSLERDAASRVASPGSSRGLATHQII